jgi:hypothetical protein
MGALGFAASDAVATCANLTVTSCGDSGAGTLRDTVACADSGDTIDLSTLSCSTITLASQINIPQASLYLTGPGQQLLSIDAANNSRVFLHHIVHTGAGTLRISDLTITRGRYQANGPEGGCIHSGGDVTLTDSTVSLCSVVGQNSQSAIGGGIYTYGNLTLVHSTLTGNTAQTAQPGAKAIGGGAAVNYNLIVKYSTISDNVAIGATSRGGGIHAPRRDVTVIASTISGNSAGVGAGIDAYLGSTRKMKVSDSTISGNSGSNWAAIYTQHPTTISNSTIAFNTSSANSPAVGAFTTTLDLQSSIIADNIGGGVQFDLGGSNVTLAGAHNLVVSSALTLPPDTIGSCPHLGPLTANGGPTLTHPLLSASPAIDQGSSAPALSNDQRGTGYPRVVGAAADIGAEERAANALDDRLFKSGFNGGCDE